MVASTIERMKKKEISKRGVCRRHEYYEYQSEGAQEQIGVAFDFTCRFAIATQLMQARRWEAYDRSAREIKEAARHLRRIIIN